MIKLEVGNINESCFNVSTNYCILCKSCDPKLKCLGPSNTPIKRCTSTRISWFFSVNLLPDICNLVHPSPASRLTLRVPSGYITTWCSTKNRTEGVEDRDLKQQLSQKQETPEDVLPKTHEFGCHAAFNLACKRRARLAEKPVAAKKHLSHCRVRGFLPRTCTNRWMPKLHLFSRDNFVLVTHQCLDDCGALPLRSVIPQLFP